MKRFRPRLNLGVLACMLALAFVVGRAAAPETATHPVDGTKQMKLGNFSVSLAVKDLAASSAFYEKLGFHAVLGDGKKMLIMQNDNSTIGLFQGLFEKNILTYNPGWDRTCATLPEFDDVRDIQRSLKNQGVKLAAEVDESSSGPGSLMLVDPDGNAILVDQHVPRPIQDGGTPKK